MKKLAKEDQKTLFEALYVMKMGELKAICKKLHLPFEGKKGELILRIKHFLLTGKTLEESKIPEVSKAQKNKTYPLKPETLIVLGAYKNDAQTRAFFKKLVGPHFHFTAFGQDWIKIRWQKGDPPTYQEFADMWQKEKVARKDIKAMPKKEWAYITFIQKYKHAHPNASKDEITKSWQKFRAEKVKLVHEILKKII